MGWHRTLGNNTHGERVAAAQYGLSEPEQGEEESESPLSPDPVKRAFEDVGAEGQQQVVETEGGEEGGRAG